MHSVFFFFFFLGGGGCVILSLFFFLLVFFWVLFLSSIENCKENISMGLNVQENLDEDVKLC